MIFRLALTTDSWQMTHPATKPSQTGPTREINLFQMKPKKRVYSRNISPEQRAAAGRFGKEYFDDPEFPGYQGYNYDGRWRKVALGIRDYFSLEHGASILDIGCGKGFLLYDLKMTDLSFRLHGVDISEYAVEQAMPEVKAGILCQSCTDLPYEDNAFDLVMTAATLHNLPEAECRQAIREINRVARENAFIMLHSYHRGTERENLVSWETAIQTVRSTDEWRQIFEDEEYQGHYWFQTFI